MPLNWFIKSFLLDIDQIVYIGICHNKKLKLQAYLILLTSNKLYKLNNVRFHYCLQLFTSLITYFHFCTFTHRITLRVRYLQSNNKQFIKLISTLIIVTLALMLSVGNNISWLNRMWRLYKRGHFILVVYRFTSHTTDHKIIIVFHFVRC